MVLITVVDLALWVTSHGTHHSCRLGHMDYLTPLGIFDPRVCQQGLSVRVAMVWKATPMGEEEQQLWCLFDTETSSAGLSQLFKA